MDRSTLIASRLYVRFVDLGEPVVCAYPEGRRPGAPCHIFIHPDLHRDGAVDAFVEIATVNGHAWTRDQIAHWVDGAYASRVGQALPRPHVVHRGRALAAVACGALLALGVLAVDRGLDVGSLAWGVHTLFP